MAAGFRGPFAPWVGGGGVVPPPKHGFGSVLAFWVGGYGRTQTSADVSITCATGHVRVRGYVPEVEQFVPVPRFSSGLPPTLYQAPLELTPLSGHIRVRGYVPDVVLDASNVKRARRRREEELLLLAA